jgi:hypothetical protein
VNSDERDRSEESEKRVNRMEMNANAYDIVGLN